MLSERDRAAIINMCQTGMSLDTLILSFPQFKADDIKAIYNEYINDTPIETSSITISCNCS